MILQIKSEMDSREFLSSEMKIWQRQCWTCELPTELHMFGKHLSKECVSTAAAIPQHSTAHTPVPRICEISQLSSPGDSLQYLRLLLRTNCSMPWGGPEMREAGVEGRHQQHSLTSFCRTHSWEQHDGVFVALRTQLKRASLISGHCICVSKRKG